MKKVLIKEKVIDTPYAPAIPAIPPRAEYWVKDFEVSHTEPEDLEGWSHIPAYEGEPEIPEQQEVSHMEVVREFQTTNEDLQKMLGMEAPGTVYEVVDITAEHEQKLFMAYVEGLIDEGANARIACQRVLDLITGFNLKSEAVTERADEMEENFALAIKYLSTPARPGKAKTALKNIPVDGVLVTEQMKSLALYQLRNYKEVEL